MKTQFHFGGLKPDPATRRQLEADLAALNRRLPVINAEILLEHQPQTAPPYQAVARLAVAGPDIHAAARDHTWAAAWLKVVTRLREEIEARPHPPQSAPKNRPA